MCFSGTNGSLFLLAVLYRQLAEQLKKKLKDPTKNHTIALGTEQAPCSKVLERKPLSIFFFTN